MSTRRNRLSTQEYADGILAGNRFVLSRAITLIESGLPADRQQARELLDRVLPYTGRAWRIGITGVPGVGKSTFVEAFGNYATTKGKLVAVLAVDPSSQRTGGSIMGDKTRMNQLGQNPRAYIRPSPSGTSLGGVSRKTREAMLLCEAAGFDLILVETVGVGQSETAVSSMTDFFLLLMLAGAGDELQGIKKGIMEMADAVVINKADGDNLQKATTARQEYENALHLLNASTGFWNPQALTCSALNGSGLSEIWTMLEGFFRQAFENGFIAQKREHQTLDWMQDTIRQQLEEHFFGNPAIKQLLPAKEALVRAGSLHAVNAASELFEVYLNSCAPLKS